MALDVFGLNFERFVLAFDVWRVPIGLTGTEKGSRQEKPLETNHNCNDNCNHKLVILLCKVLLSTG